MFSAEDIAKASGHACGVQKDHMHNTTAIPSRSHQHIRDIISI